jgi:hypothetical protein
LGSIPKKTRLHKTELSSVQLGRDLGHLTADAVKPFLVVVGAPQRSPRRSSWLIAAVLDTRAPAWDLADMLACVDALLV